MHRPVAHAQTEAGCATTLQLSQLDTDHLWTAVYWMLGAWSEGWNSVRMCVNRPGYAGASKAIARYGRRMYILEIRSCYSLRTD